MTETEGKSSFIHTPKRISASELGLETAKLKKEFREKLLSHLFSATFLVFIIIFMLVIAGVILLFSSKREFTEISEYWKWVIPFATTYMGYAIGQSRKQDAS